MGSRSAVLVLAVGVVSLPAACDEGDEIPSGGNAGTRSSSGGSAGGSSGSSHGGGGTTSGGGTGARASAGASGASSANGGTANTSAQGGATSAGGSTSTGGASGTVGSSGRVGAGAANGGTGGDAGSPSGGMAGDADADTNAGEGGNDASNVGCDAGMSRMLVPSATGWIDAQDVCNDIGIQGAWGVYGDRYGDATCIHLGLHEPEECSFVSTPDPSGGFPNVGGVMHTAGTIAKILPCNSGVTTTGCPDHDYRNMWGAGIGLDFNVRPLEEGGTHTVWDPAPHEVIGIAFTIDQVPVAGMRVEFPMLLTDAEASADTPPLPPGSTTEDHSTLSPYFGAQLNGDRKYPASPLVNGENWILWADIQPPSLAAYTFDTKRLLGIRFHVLASTTATSFDFKISKLTFLRN